MSSIVKLHPETLRYLKSGHFWVTKDRFTERFPEKEFWLEAWNGKQQLIGVFLHDFTHPKIKARLWSNQKSNFSEELNSRLSKSIERRSSSFEDRDNVYLTFGEADQLPGLHILKLGEVYIFQYYAFYWKEFEQELLSSFKKVIGVNNPVIYRQIRNHEQEKETTLISGEACPNFILNEFNIKYSIKLQKYYDFGIYTDMASIRKKIIPLYKNKSILNLYSYTGAFSLAALVNGARLVHSVDLSKKYLKWLNENIDLNFPLETRKMHKSSCKSTQDFLSKSKDKYDFIVCDPPSSSSNGKKVSKALKEYEKLIPLLLKNLEDGGKMLLFINTHQIKLEQFKEKVLSSLRKNKSSIKIEREFKLGNDCPVTKGFPEGNYLKGILLG